LAASEGSLVPGTEAAAKRYARAAFELATERAEAAAWTTALEQMGEFMRDAEVRRVLENTRVAQDAKQQLINAALGDLPPLPLNLARLLVRKSRTALAADIVTEFKRLVEEAQGVAHARATTAVALSEADRGALARRLQERTGRQIVLETEVDPRLVGGVVIQIGDRLVDASTRARLEALRESLTG
jgi:F-type H+-transporting ATPase subunit delta